jgi:DNA-binding NarL/FixJ family response regulator
VKAISLMLNLSTKTVEWHQGQLYRNLQIWDLAGLTRAALLIGLIDL